MPPAQRTRRQTRLFDPFAAANKPQWGHSKAGARIELRRANKDDLRRLAGSKKINVAGPDVGQSLVIYWIDVTTGAAHPYDAVVVSKRLRGGEGIVVVPKRVRGGKGLVVVPKRVRRGKGYAVRYVTGEIEEIPAHEGRMHWVVASQRRRGRVAARPKVRTCRCGARFTGRRSAQALGGHRSKCNRDTVVIA